MADIIRPTLVLSHPPSLFTSSPPFFLILCFLSAPPRTDPDPERMWPPPLFFIQFFSAVFFFDRDHSSSRKRLPAGMSSCLPPTFPGDASPPFLCIVSLQSFAFFCTCPIGHVRREKSTAPPSDVKFFALWFTFPLLSRSPPLAKPAPALPFPRRSVLRCMKGSPFVPLTLLQTFELYIIVAGVVGRP